MSDRQGSTRAKTPHQPQLAIEEATEGAAAAAARLHLLITIDEDSAGHPFEDRGDRRGLANVKAAHSWDCPAAARPLPAGRLVTKTPRDAR